MAGTVDAMLSSFEGSLRVHLEKAGPEKKRQTRKLRELLDSPPSRRRTRLLERLERHTIAHLQAEGKLGNEATFGAIDWSTVDWNKILDFVMKLLTMLIPLFT
jgi:hypothetical protein